MIKIGIIKEGKIPQDNRVPFSPVQCKNIQEKFSGVKFTVQPSPNRCFNDDEYLSQGIELNEDLSDCDILFGVKEPIIDSLIPNKTYLFFSHTKKAQPYNQKLMKALIEKKIRMIDYECLTHDDGHRIVGFGYWAGVVGAHNGLLTYGKKFKQFSLKTVHSLKNFQELKDTYENFFLPPIKIALTGSGRVATGVLDILQYLDVAEVSVDDYLSKRFTYPVFVHLKGKDLYARKDDSTYQRDDFHANPQDYTCLFLPFSKMTDILMNGIYWDKNIPRLFELEDMKRPDFNLPVISDITCDENGSVPCNIGSTSIADPVYGFDKNTMSKAPPFQNSFDVVDVMAVDNLPNELPRDASKYFGAFLEEYVLPDLVKNSSSGVIERATICKAGKLTSFYEYLSDYAYH
ncbi:MAG TPA: NAD(P)-dependent oxidoreductase [Chitinophagaceae bacterium]|nr:MAG: alanine dehydrogenase [Bacteroidetes bacterium OLB11]HMN32860.1 NAD(P)-dependent oxidoreductase [Chitinophagaceae bacterium]